jgi:hypothetical protein
VPADPDKLRRRRVLSKDRMEGFSHGVFGFASTLLVLNIALRPPGTPLQQVLHAWPAYLAYIISFLTIGGAWLMHTALTDQLGQVVMHRHGRHLGSARTDGGVCSAVPCPASASCAGGCDAAAPVLALPGP